MNSNIVECNFLYQDVIFFKGVIVNISIIVETLVWNKLKGVFDSAHVGDYSPSLDQFKADWQLIVEGKKEILSFLILKDFNIIHNDTIYNVRELCSTHFPKGNRGINCAFLTYLVSYFQCHLTFSDDELKDLIVLHQKLYTNYETLMKKVNEL
jgi:hypothetical protein